MGNPIMLKDRTISESYRPALWRALITSLAIGALSVLVLDGGLTAMGLAVFWTSVVVVIWRRPQNPTRVDLLLISWGCLPLLVGFEAAIWLVWHPRGFA